MSKVLDVEAASSPAEEAEDYSFADFKKEQAAAKESGISVQFEKTAESSPASEPVIVAEPPKGATAAPKQALTDAEKSERKHANDGKRIPGFIKAISEKDAEIARLNRELAARGTSAAPAKDAAKPEIKDDPNDPAPDPKDPKYAGENGWLAFLDDRSEHKARKAIKADRATQAEEKAESEARVSAGSFGEKMDAYKETQSERIAEFDEAFEIVRDALETEFPAVSSAIAGHEKAPELIDYLGTNLDVFSRITSAKGQPMAMKIFRQILADFEKPVSEATTTKPLPKPPVNLNGRGRTPTGEEVQNKAAEDDDFTTWRQAERSKPKQKSRWDR